MKLKEIKRGKWYQTKQGIGQCLSVGGTRPISVSFNITQPLPRGRVNMPPRDVWHEINSPEKWVHAAIVAAKQDDAKS